MTVNTALQFPARNKTEEEAGLEGNFTTLHGERMRDMIDSIDEGHNFANDMLNRVENLANRQRSNIQQNTSSIQNAQMVSQLSNVLKNVSDQNDPIHQITRDAMMNILANLGGEGANVNNNGSATNYTSV